jgi:hypothetical protein
MKKFCLLVFVGMILLSCGKNPLDDPSVIPTLTTTAVSSITTTSATSGGNISSDGGAAITARGVCWSISVNPSIAGNHTTDGTGTGSFTSSIAGLTQATTYYARAYATNSVGTAYGNEITFITSVPDIYVAGNENNGTVNIAKVWKNGTPTNLTNGNFNALAYSIFVSGTDVYAAGSEYNA